MSERGTGPVNWTYSFNFATVGDVPAKLLATPQKGTDGLAGRARTVASIGVAQPKPIEGGDAVTGDTSRRSAGDAPKIVGLQDTGEGVAPSQPSLVASQVRKKMVQLPVSMKNARYCIVHSGAELG